MDVVVVSRQKTDRNYSQTVEIKAETDFSRHWLTNSVDADSSRVLTHDGHMIIIALGMTLSNQPQLPICQNKAKFTNLLIPIKNS